MPSERRERKAKITSGKDKRKLVEFVCAPCDRRWEALSIDTDGIRLTDSEMRLCSKCGQHGNLTGLVF